MTRYWWVNHKQTFRQEIAGKYLWSPKTEKGGKRSQYYENMLRACPGDLVLSYANTEVQFVGRVIDYAFSCARPEEFGATGASWSPEGWLLPVSWRRLPRAVRPKDLMGELSKILPKKYSPIQHANGNGNQKAYLTEIEFPAFDVVVSAAGASKELPNTLDSDTPRRDDFLDLAENVVEQCVLADPSLSATEKERVVKARYGQGIFRSNVEVIEKSCRITGVSEPNILVASHIKPWRLCVNSNERLDGNNGLLLTPTVDRLFDRGLITFTDTGAVLVSSRLEQECLRKLGFLEKFSIGVGAFSTAQAAYLEFHRKNIFLI